MKLLLIACLAVSVSLAAHVPDIFNEDEIIKNVENSNALWKAGRNFGPNTSYSFIKRLLGAQKDGPKLPTKPFTKLSDLPVDFDSRKQWSNCTVISQVRDQGNCGSCWATATASAFSDRLCVASSGAIDVPLSTDELISCCDYCGAGCGGGSPEAAWGYFISSGLVTGGEYGSNVGCQPYEIEKCDHHETGPLPLCDDTPPAHTPNCKVKCINPTYKIDFKDDLHYVSEIYGFDDEEQIKQDIYNYGSVAAKFVVYEDFLTYRSGVYNHVTGASMGLHAVRALGWGEENGTPYWLVANSWNEDWGDKGLFKILRGTDECGIERDMTAGKALPK